MQCKKFLSNSRMEKKDIYETEERPIEKQPSLRFSTPHEIYCPTCRFNVCSRTSFVNGKLTWLSCTVISLLGGVFGCCAIPFFCNSCKDVQHSCPRCQNVLGIYDRLELHRKWMKL
uniref:Lipopolysaccharide-induced tumor necrosis factor-alpha factor homolog n=1 Tax=Schistocephalus solidus TaxID=70667 RepID=A0A0X3P0G8_SCHSO